MVRVQVINESSLKKPRWNGWVLCLQWCRYIYDDGKMELGFRFIWRDPDNKLRPQRGQARIPTIKDAESLIERAKNEGWGNEKGDD